MAIKILAETEVGSGEDQPSRDKLIHVQPYRWCPDLDSLKPDRGFLLDFKAMDPQHLQHRLTEIQSHIDDFKQRLAESEDHYRTSLGLLTDPKLCSSLMEHHIIHTERQKAAIARLEELYSQVQNRLVNSD